MDNPRQKLESWPGLAFALIGGVFALLYVLIRPTNGLASFFVADEPFPFGVLLVVGSSVSAFLVGTLLWSRFIGDASMSKYRPAILGALVGTLSMPLTMLIITFSRYLFTGLPDDLVFGSPPPGTTQWTSAEALFLQDIWIALFTSLFGFIFTAGLPIILGAATGVALRQFTANDELVSHGQ